MIKKAFKEQLFRPTPCYGVSSSLRNPVAAFATKVIVLLVSLFLDNAYAATKNIESPDGSKVYISEFLTVEYATIVDAVRSHFDDETRLLPWEISRHAGIEFHHVDEESFEECTSYADCTVGHLVVPISVYSSPYALGRRVWNKNFVFAVKGSSVPFVSELELIDPLTFSPWRVLYSSFIGASFLVDNTKRPSSSGLGTGGR